MGLNSPRLPNKKCHSKVGSLRIRKTNPTHHRVWFLWKGWVFMYYLYIQILLYILYTYYIWTNICIYISTYLYEFIYLPIYIYIYTCILYIFMDLFLRFGIENRLSTKPSSSVASFRICDLAIEGWKWMGNGGNTWHFVPYFHRLLSSCNHRHHSERRWAVSYHSQKVG